MYRNSQQESNLSGVVLLSLSKDWFVLEILLVAFSLWHETWISASLCRDHLLCARIRSKWQRQHMVWLIGSWFEQEVTYDSLLSPEFEEWFIGMMFTYSKLNAVISILWLKESKLPSNWGPSAAKVKDLEVTCRADSASSWGVRIPSNWLWLSWCNIPGRDICWGWK